MENLILLPQDELNLRISHIREAAREAGATGSLLITDNANLYYLTGRVYSGWALISLDDNREPTWFLRRPAHLEGENIHRLRKPEEIPALLQELGIPMPDAVGYEMDSIPYSTVTRLMAVFPDAAPFNANRLMSLARSVKTPMEISKMEQSGLKQEEVYRRIPSLFNPGMTDFELDVAIENLSRTEGCLGQFRISGTSMEFFMGNILTGENADEPSPYDFALGGRGIDPSLPVGATGEEIKLGSTVSVDVNGDYTGYMTDMTRVYSWGDIPQLALDAHACSLAIHRAFRRRALPGVKASDLYEMAASMAREAGLERYFMGHRQKAPFCGHGVGIEINELPVIAPRSRDILKENNTIALEPKFVIPGVGAVGIENTYQITPKGARSLTNAPEDIIPLLD